MQHLRPILLLNRPYLSANIGLEKITRRIFILNTEIYYFSGTGNSLAVARDIAEKTNGKLISISAAINKKSIKTEADSIGIVFPAYMAQLYGVPLIVERFIKKLEDIGSKYIFAVCTCGGLENFNGLPALKKLDKIIKSKGGKLSAEFSIKLPMNTLDYSHIPVPVSQNREAMFKNCKYKIEIICQCVTNKEKNRYRIIKSLLNCLMTPAYLMLQKIYLKELKKSSKELEDTNLKYYELMPLTDKSIYTDERCNGCAICAKVCPVQNIKMIEDKPVWQHHCEMCLACAEWCPKKAIHHWCRVEGKDYHHPEVKISDMMMCSVAGLLY
jgi:flavodoxin/Pyruvate/2-oxoacid:ferredoxin oxidoreductase delta subunit